jgi:hypothetical protein
MDEATNGLYSQASSKYKSDSAVINALDEVRDLFKRSTRPDDLLAKVKDMSEAERHAFQIGSRDAIDEVMGNLKNDALGAAICSARIGMSRSYVPWLEMTKRRNFCPILVGRMRLLTPMAQFNADRRLVAAWLRARNSRTRLRQWPLRWPIQQLWVRLNWAAESWLTHFVTLPIRAISIGLPPTQPEC